MSSSCQACFPLSGLPLRLSASCCFHCYHYFCFSENRKMLPACYGPPHALSSCCSPKCLPSSPEPISFSSFPVSLALPEPAPPHHPLSAAVPLLSAGILTSSTAISSGNPGCADCEVPDTRPPSPIMFAVPLLKRVQNMYRVGTRSCSDTCCHLPQGFCSQDRTGKLKL